MSTSGRLTTHVLDTALGKPAQGLKIDLFRVEGDKKYLVRTVWTNADGRIDRPVLEGEFFVVGVYELLFHAGDYLRDVGAAMPDPAFVDLTPPFLDLIPLRFGISDAASHYHVPLLLSPFSYSTYRGS